MRTTDAAPVAAYRNDPEVARYQSWNLPFTEQDAPLMATLGRLKLDVVQVQQWLTDISATRAQDGQGGVHRLVVTGSDRRLSPSTAVACHGPGA